MGKKTARVSWAALSCAGEGDLELGQHDSRFQALYDKCKELLDQLGNLSQTVTASICWSMCSIGMTLLNKRAVKMAGTPLAVVVLQMLVTVGCAAATRNLQFGEGTKLWAMSVPPLFAAMMATSILALSHVSVGTFVVVRNLGPIVTLGIESVVHNPDELRCNKLTICSTAAIAIGVLIYEYSDLRFSPIGVVYLLLNLSFACAERLLQRHLLVVRGVSVSKPGLMLLNNAIGAGLTLLMAVLFGEGRQMGQLLHRMRHHTSVTVPVLGSCVAGALISYTGLWLQGLVTATSFMVLGCFNKIVVVAWGIIFLHDSTSALSLLGAFISITGCGVYAMIK